MYVNWRGLAQYLTSGSKSFWVWFSLFVLPFLSVLVWKEPADLDIAFRIEGMLQQLGGLVFVAVGLRDVQIAFDVKSLRSRISEHVAGIGKFIGPIEGRVDIHLEPRSAHIRGSGAVVRQGLRADATLEQRVEFLERQANEMQNALERQATSLNAETERVNQALLDEETQRQAADTALKNMLKELSTGGIILEWIGLFWLFQGTILVGIPSELSALASWLA